MRDVKRQYLKVGSKTVTVKILLWNQFSKFDRKPINESKDIYDQLNWFDLKGKTSDLRLQNLYYED